MTHILKELKFIKKKADKNVEPAREFIRAVITSHEGNIRVPGHPEKVYTSELGVPESLIPAINYTVQDMEGLPVLLGWNTNPLLEERIIVSIDSGIPTSVSFSDYNVPNHAITHEWFTEDTAAPDPVRVFQPAMMPLKTVVNASSLVVKVEPLTYVSGRRIIKFPGQQLDLTPFLPAAGNTKYVLIYLDKSTNTLSVESGEEVVIGLTPVKPSIPDRFVETSSLIQLSAGQTGIDVATQYTDAREFLGSDVSTVLPATQVGQIMYSLNGSEFSAELPITNNNGIMVNDQGTILVI